MSCLNEDDDDRDAPQLADLVAADEEDDDDTVPCGVCGHAVHHLAPRCPRCGQWLFDEGLAAGRSRRWFWPIMVALLVAVILVLWHGLFQD